MRYVLLALCLSSTIALADPAPEPTVAFTQKELQTLIGAELSRLAAAPLYARINEAFSPPTPPAVAPRASPKPDE